MKPSLNLLLSIVTVGTIGLLAFTKHIRAGFEPTALDVHVEVEDTDFGVFENISGLEKLNLNSGEGFNRIVLKRHFVTDPSFYLWARNVSKEHVGPKNVNLIYKDQEGNEISRVVLKASQPIAWTVEASDPTLGGFHERIELAVQKVIKE